MPDVHPLKSVSIADIESAVAKALTELTGQRFESSVSTMTIESPSSTDVFLGRPNGAVSLLLTLKPVDPADDVGEIPF